MSNYTSPFNRNHPKIDIAAIKAKYNIADIAGRYIKVTPRGNKFIALCPFHADRHPSLTLSPAHAAYHCFACGAKGDIFSLVQHLEKCTFVEAAERITGGLFSSYAPPPLPPPAQAVISEVTAAENIRFLQSLQPYVPACVGLRDAYRSLEVGVSPRLPAVQYQTYSLQGMWGRLIFPIRSKEGELVGFSARRLEGASSSSSSSSSFPSPKYRNTSFKDGFCKGDHLYALHHALPFIKERKTLYIAEGYKDALALHAAGFPNSVALCGIALTTQHIALLTALAPQVHLLLDGDKAGAEASQHITAQLLNQVSCRTHLLPKGEDPDSLFVKYGREGVRGVVE